MERAKEAQGVLRRYTPEALRRAAKFHESDSTDATMLAVFETLKRTSTGELIEHLRDAVDAKNLALAEALRLRGATRLERPAPYRGADARHVPREEAKASADPNAVSPMERINAYRAAKGQAALDGGHLKMCHGMRKAVGNMPFYRNNPDVVPIEWDIACSFLFVLG